MPGIYGALAQRQDRDPRAVADAMREMITHQPWYKVCLDQKRERVLGAVSTNPDFDAATHLAADGEVRLLR